MGMLNLDLAVDHENSYMFASLESSDEEEKAGLWLTQRREELGCMPFPWPCGKGGRPARSHRAGPLPLAEAATRWVRSYAEKGAQGELVVASCSLQRDKRARGDKSLPMGAFAVLTLALTVF